MGGLAGYTGCSDERLIHTMMHQQKCRGIRHARFLSRRDCTLSDFEPETSDSGIRSVAAVLDGFISNRKQLQAELKAEGYPYECGSDTALLQHLWTARGISMLNRLEGMYAFALWDPQESCLYLVRDRTGSRPLYYHERKDAFFFASTIKGLLGYTGIRKTLDLEGLDDYFAFLHPLPPRTFYKEIRQVPAGHYARRASGQLEVKRYWHPICQPKENCLLEEWVVSTDTLLENIIDTYADAEASEGALLSGGLDSTVVLAYLSRHLSGVPSFTLGFTEEEAHYDERRAARTTASLLKSACHEVFMHPDLPNNASFILEHFDEPFGNPSALLAEILFREAAKSVSVVFTGDGGDEAFGGYPRYRGLLWAGLYRHMPFCLRRHVLHPLIHMLPERAGGLHTLRRLRRFSEGSFLDPVDCYALWMEHQNSKERLALYNSNLTGILCGRDATEPVRQLMRQCDSPDIITQALYADISLFLPANVLCYGDRLSHAHGVEMRAPLCEGALFTHLLQAPSFLKVQHFADKQLLRMILHRQLPERKVSRKKRGLNPPMSIWLNRWLEKPGAWEHFLQETTAVDLFEPGRVRELLTEHRSGLRDHSWRLWPLYLFARWFNTPDPVLPTY